MSAMDHQDNAERWPGRSSAVTAAAAQAYSWGPCAIRQEFRVSAKAQEIVDALKSVLEGGVSLLDVDKGMHHLAMRHEEWWSFAVDKQRVRSVQDPGLTPFRSFALNCFFNFISGDQRAGP